MLLVVDARAGVMPGRRGARRDPPQLAQAGARAREQDRRPLPGDARARGPPARARRADPALGHARPRDRGPARRDRGAARGCRPGAAGDRRRGDPGGDPRAAERRQVVPLQQAGRRGADDRLRGAGDDPRLDRHRARSRRPGLPARRHRGPSPQAEATAGDRVLLRAPRARDGGTSGRRAGADRRERGDRRGGPRCRGRRTEGPVLDARRPLQVGPFDRDDRGRPPGAAAAPSPAAADRDHLGEDRPRDRAGPRQGRRAVRQARRPHLDRRAEPVPRRAKEARQPPREVASASTSSTARRSPRGRLASASRSTTRASSPAITATGSRTSCASGSASRASRS